MSFLQVYPLFNDVHTQQFAGWSTVRTAKAVVEFQIALWLSMKFTYKLIIIWSVSCYLAFVSEIMMPWGVLYITSGGRHDQRVRPRAISPCCRPEHSCSRSSPLSQASLAMVAALKKSSLVQFGLRQIHLAWASLNRRELILLRRNTFYVLM